MLRKTKKIVRCLYNYGDEGFLQNRFLAIRITALLSQPMIIHSYTKKRLFVSINRQRAAEHTISRLLNLPVQVAKWAMFQSLAGAGAIQRVCWSYDQHTCRSLDIASLSPREL